MNKSHEWQLALGLLSEKKVKSPRSGLAEPSKEIQSIRHSFVGMVFFTCLSWDGGKLLHVSYIVVILTCARRNMKRNNSHGSVFDPPPSQYGDSLCLAGLVFPPEGGRCLISMFSNKRTHAVLIPSNENP